MEPWPRLAQHAADRGALMIQSLTTDDVSRGRAGGDWIAMRSGVSSTGAQVAPVAGADALRGPIAA